MTKLIKILLVEDNPADANLTIENFERLKIANKLEVVVDGVEAMAYLHGEAPFENAVRPDLVLLDLNLPRMDGRDVLSQMKEDPDLQTIPVVVLTSSEAEEDVLRSYKLQASAYVKKPVDLDGFERIVRGIEGFWFSVVKFPVKE